MIAPRHIASNRLRSIRNFFVSKFPANSGLPIGYSATRLFTPPEGATRWGVVELGESRNGYPWHGILSLYCCSQGGDGEGVDLAEAQDQILEVLDEAEWEIPLWDYRSDPPEFAGILFLQQDEIRESVMMETEGIRFKTIAVPISMTSAF